MVVVWLFSNRVQRSYFRKYELCVETRERRGRDERRDVREILILLGGKCKMRLEGRLRMPIENRQHEKRGRLCPITRGNLFRAIWGSRHILSISANQLCPLCFLAPPHCQTTSDWLFQPLAVPSTNKIFLTLLKHPTGYLNPPRKHDLRKLQTRVQDGDLRRDRRCHFLQTTCDHKMAGK
jgi:hypothetical protein